MPRDDQKHLIEGQTIKWQKERKTKDKEQCSQTPALK